MIAGVAEIENELGIFRNIKVSENFINVGWGERGGTINIEVVIGVGGCGEGGSVVGCRNKVADIIVGKEDVSVSIGGSVRSETFVGIFKVRISNGSFEI